MNDSRDFKDAESARRGLSHVRSQPALLPPYRDPGGMLSRPGGMLSRNDKPPDILNTHGFSGNVFVNPPASSSSPYPGGFNRWISNVTEDTSLHVTSEPSNPRHSFGPVMPVRTVSQKFIRPRGGKIFKGLWADQQRLQISELHFDKFPTCLLNPCNVVAQWSHHSLIQ